MTGIKSMLKILAKVNRVRSLSSVTVKGLRNYRRRISLFIKARHNSWPICETTILTFFPDYWHKVILTGESETYGKYVKQFRRHWLAKLGLAFWDQCLLDPKPVFLVGFRRSKKRSDFLSSAGYSFYASENMDNFGYKLVMLITLRGIPLLYELRPVVERSV